MNIKKVFEGNDLSGMKRKLIKIILVFFLFMIAFTIISRAAFNVTAAQVKTVFPDEEKILHDFSASGELKGKQQLAIATVEGLLIKKVCVTEGETVTSGRTLYELDAEKLQEAISSCKQELEPEPSNDAKSDNKQSYDPARAQKKQELNALVSLQLNGGRIHAQRAGIISEINVKPGDKTSGGGDILYADASEGLQLIVQVTEDDRETLKKSGKVTVTGDNGKSVSNLKVKSITVDKESPDLYNVIVDINSKKLKIGTIAEMKVENATGPFDTCIPREALHLNDQGTYYVYTIKEIDTVLGTQLEAQKVEVELLDKNDTTAAVEGVTNDQEIIIEASKGLDNKARVRRMNQ